MLFVRLLNGIYRSCVHRDLLAVLCSDERSFVAHPSLADAGQHPASSDDVLRHDADRSRPEPILAGRRDRRRSAAEHNSSLAVDVLSRPRHPHHHQLLHADIPFRRRSTYHCLLPDTG